MSTGIVSRLALAGVMSGSLLMPSPAHAAVVVPTAGNCGYLSQQQCAGAGQALPLGLSTLAVAFSCTATTPFVVNSTGVECYLRGLSDNLIYMRTGPTFVSGQQASVSNAGVVPFQAYRICVGAGYLTTGGTFRATQGFTCI